MMLSSSGLSFLLDVYINLSLRPNPLSGTKISRTDNSELGIREALLMLLDFECNSLKRNIARETQTK